MNKEFQNGCNKEIEKNKHKGKWTKWKPSRKKVFMEFMWHVGKLSSILMKEDLNEYDRSLLKEYACDVANYCEKIFIMSDNTEVQVTYGTYQNTRKEVRHWALTKEEDEG